MGKAKRKEAALIAACNVPPPVTSHATTATLRPMAEEISSLKTLKLLFFSELPFIIIENMCGL